jgi:hypothetical protein
MSPAKARVTSLSSRSCCEQHRLTGFQVGAAGGKDNFGRHFNAIVAGSGREKLRRLLVLGDNDDSPQANLTRVREALAAAGFAAPPAPLEAAGADPEVAVFMVPSAQQPGDLETLIARAIYEKRPDLKRCLEQLRECIPELDSWSPANLAKMQVHASIATCCSEDPSAALRYVFGKTGNPIPLESAHYEELLRFLRSFAP